MRQCVIVKNLIESRSISLEKYLQDISKFRALTPNEEYDLVVRAKSGSERAKNHLFLCNLRFVVSVAKQYQNQGLALPDLINEGNLGLLKAFGNFDETKGFKFISYAVWWIRQYISSAIADNARIIRLPHNKLNFLSRMNACFKQLEHKLHREPNVVEIAEALNESVEDVDIHLKLSKDTLSLDFVIDNGEQKQTFEEACSLIKYKMDDERNIFDLMSMHDDMDRMFSLLPEREAEVIKWYYGFYNNYPMTLDEIGTRMGLTGETIRVVKHRALTLIKKIKCYENLKVYL